ncbi:hypothetical protein, partial [Azospirillum sp.]|uniref:hypothetical protein n=1 Tax=Azospirillum sp. TaxID=34012 RepID=UPI002D39A998
SRNVAGIEELLKDLGGLDQVLQGYVFASVLSTLDEAVNFILHSSVPGKKTWDGDRRGNVYPAI